MNNVIQCQSAGQRVRIATRPHLIKDSEIQVQGSAHVGEEPPVEGSLDASLLAIDVVRVAARGIDFQHLEQAPVDLWKTTVP